MMTAGLGRRGAPTFPSLYSPKNSRYHLARLRLFQLAKIPCVLNLQVRVEQIHIRRAFDFIRGYCESYKPPQDIWLGLFEDQYKHCCGDNWYHEIPDLPLFTEEFLMPYINSLEAAISVLDTESAIAMFAEDEQV